MNRHDIVVIGASAGGLGPLKALLGPLDPQFPAALFLVTHLAAGPSRLDEILAGSTSLRVLFAEDGDLIRPGTLLIAPPDRHLILERERVALRRGPRENLWRPAVDVLFRSAAVAFRSRTIGVILSGALDDGASGLQALAQCGGVAVVQSPAEAAYPGMPEAALSAVPDARVMPASAIAAALRELAAEPAPPPPSVPEQILLEAVLAAGDEQANRQIVESSLWAAIRLLEQRANLDRARGNQERHRGRSAAAESYLQRAAEVNGHAHVLREMLAKLPDSAQRARIRECTG